MSYELYYWPTIQGRGEFVRLALEEAGTPDKDAAGDGARCRHARIAAFLATSRFTEAALRAPVPEIRANRCGTAANILKFLGDELERA